MDGLIKLKELSKSIYGKYDTYVISLWKFMLALIGFIVINTQLGQMGKLNNIIIVLILALICSFLPANAIVLLGSGMIIAHLYAISLEALIVGGGVILVLLLLYFGTAPKEAFALIMTPIAFALHIPCLIPLLFGLVGTPMAAVGIAFGTIGYYSIQTIGNQKVEMAGLPKDAAEAMVHKITLLLDGILKNPAMVMTVIIMIAVILAVYFIRRMAIQHAWSVSIGAGAFMFMAVSVLGQLILGLKEGILALVVGTGVSVIIAFLVKFFLFRVDYTKTEKVQFEDDEYYYFVTAVPKLTTDDSKSNIQQEWSDSRHDVRIDRRRGTKIEQGEDIRMEPRRDVRIEPRSDSAQTAERIIRNAGMYRGQQGERPDQELDVVRRVGAAAIEGEERAYRPERVKRPEATEYSVRMNRPVRAGNPDKRDNKEAGGSDIDIRNY